MILVQCDFDGTITVENVSEIIRSAFGPIELQAMEEEYLQGKWTVEESNIRQFALVHTTKKEIEDLVIESVVIRYAFDEFVNYCKGEDIRFVIVSSGLNLYIDPILQQLELTGLEVHSAIGDVSINGINLEYRDPSGSVITSGFKQSHLRHFRESGHSIVYIGDGLSDIEPALQADLVIARDELETYFKKHQLPYANFRNFKEAGEHVERFRSDGKSDQ